MAEKRTPRGLYGQRPSKSADAVRRAEFDEIRRMTIRERMLAALELQDRPLIELERSDRMDPV